MKEQILLISIPLTQLDDMISCAVRKAVSVAVLAQAPKFTNPKKTTGVSGASEITGYSKSTIYSLVQKKTIPFYKVKGGSKLIFNIAELQDWIQSEKSGNAGDVINQKHKTC